MMLIKQIGLAFIVVTTLILTTVCSTVLVPDRQTVAQNATRMLAPVDGRAALPKAMAGASRVELEVADAGRGSSSRLVAWVFEPSENLAKRGAVVALHGCGGLYDRKGDLSARHRTGAERLTQQGFVVLLPDSFGRRACRRANRSGTLSLCPPRIRRARVAANTPNRRATCTRRQGGDRRRPARSPRTLLETRQPVARAATGAGVVRAARRRCSRQSFVGPFFPAPLSGPEQLA